MWQTPCHLPELGLTARLQTGAWVGLNHEGRVWGTGEWASAPRPGCRHCSLSHRLVATALGTASLHPSLPPLGEEETEAQGPTAFPRSHTQGVELVSRAMPTSQPPLWPLRVLTATGTARRFPMWAWAASGLGSGAWTPASVPRAAWKTPWRSTTELGFS